MYHQLNVQTNAGNVLMQTLYRNQSTVPYRGYRQYCLLDTSIYSIYIYILPIEL